jgi:hypothetical protein
MTSRAALPLPDDVEADIARALYLRDLEPDQRYFWALEAAFVFDARGSVNDATEGGVGPHGRVLGRPAVARRFHRRRAVCR